MRDSADTGKGGSFGGYLGSFWGCFWVLWGHGCIGWPPKTQSRCVNIKKKFKCQYLAGVLLSYMKRIGRSSDSLPTTKLRYLAVPLPICLVLTE